MLNGGVSPFEHALQPVNILHLSYKTVIAKPQCGLAHCLSGAPDASIDDFQFPGAEDER
jgi:hypothetical protein